MGLKEGQDLSGLLGYQLQRINLMLMEGACAAVADFGITPAKVTAMILIRDNAGCDQSTLGRALSINRASAMKLVNALAEKAYVERLPGRDLRSNALHLTAAGEQALEQMIARLQQEEADFIQRLSCSERSSLMRLMGKLRAE